MAKLSTLLIYAALTLLSCSSIPFAAREGRHVPDGFLGISPDGSALKEADYALLDDLGATWTRRTLRWTSVEREPGAWDFSSWDAYVDNGKAAGKKLLITLGFDNGYLYDDKREHRDLSERELPYFLEYIEKTVTHYKGRVDAWEIWNEPNWIFWKGSDEHFFALAKAAAQKIREVDPDAKIVSAAFWRTPEKFIRGMFEAGAMENVDAVSFHPYAINPKGAVKLFDKLAGILADYGFKGEVWATEVGYPTAGWYPTRVGEDGFPAYIVKTVAGLAARGTEAIIWYELFNDHNKGEEPSKMDSEAFFGLAYPDFSYKKGAYAYRLCSRYLSGTEYAPSGLERSGLPGSVVSLYFRGGGTNALILWSEGAERKARLAVSRGGDGMAGSRADTAPVIHDIASDREEFLASDAITITKTPLFITWEGDGIPSLQKSAK